jgi:uncharacterized membrane protein YheB (UPF0754 family)
MRYLISHFIACLLVMFAIGQLNAQVEQPRAVVDVAVVDGVAIDGEDVAEKQQLAQLRTHLKSQLSFIKSALELTVEQTEKLAAFNDDWLLAEYRETVKKKAAPKNLGNALVQAFGGGVAVMPQMQDGEDPAVKSTRSNIDKKVNELLTTQQQEQLKQERKAKENFQAEALAEFTVVLIERQIHLSDDQAHKLVPALTGKINKNCGWHVYLSNPQYIPTIPKAALSGILSDEHVRFIRSLNQQDFIGNDFGLGQMMGMMEAVEVDNPF